MAAAARGTIEYEHEPPKPAATAQLGKRNAAAEFAFQRPRNDELYVLPPRCDDRSCVNHGGRTRPRDTYFLCPGCSKRAPDAYAAGYARLPLGWPKMKKKDRDAWTRKTNATVLLVALRVMLQASPGTPPMPAAPERSLPPGP